MQDLSDTICTATLHQRLGGDAGIRRIVDGMVDAHLRNPVLKARFLPYLETPDRVEEIKRQIVAHLAAASGGPDPYKGRSMADAHRGMNIDEAEYVAAIDDVLTAMEDLGHDGATRDEVLALLYPLKSEILRT